jgi:hypothetical protein
MLFAFIACSYIGLGLGAGLRAKLVGTLARVVSML